MSEPEYEIYGTLVVSTAHLPDIRSGPAGECNLSAGPAIVTEGEYGWRLYVGCDEPRASEYGRLGPVVAVARASGCRWLEFDSDGDQWPVLPRWDDSGQPLALLVPDAGPCPAALAKEAEAATLDRIATWAEHQDPAADLRVLLRERAEAAKQ